MKITFFKYTLDNTFATDFYLNNFTVILYLLILKKLIN